MLIAKPIESNDIVSLKLSNGDELIAKVSMITEYVVTVTKPMIMMIAQDPRTGAPGVQMVPFWMVGGDREATYPIQRAQVVCMVKAGADAAKNYMANTSSLAIPGNGLIK